MSRRPVKWSVMREATSSLPDAITDKYNDQQWAFGYMPERSYEGPVGANVAGETVALDAQGALSVSVPTDAKTDVAYQYTFEGDVEDVSRQHIANRSSVILHPAPWYIGLKRPANFQPQARGAAIEVLTAGLNGATVPGVRGDHKLFRVQDTSVNRA